MAGSWVEGNKTDEAAVAGTYYVQTTKFLLGNKNDYNKL